MTAVRVDHEIYTGDRLAFDVTTGGGLTAARLTCTVKRYRNDRDVDALTRLTTENDPDWIEALSDTVARVDFGANVTRSWPVGDLWYDLQADPNSEESYTVARGVIRARRRVTRVLSSPRLIAEVGALTLASAGATLTHGYHLVADAGALALSGADVGLNAVSLSPLGADLLHHWEVPHSADGWITLVGSKVSQLDDRASAAKHLTQSEPLTRPDYEAAGGPNGRPCISVLGAQVIANESLEVPAGERLGVYAVFSMPALGTGINWGLTAPADGIDQARIGYTSLHGGWNAHATDEAVNVTSPAHTEAFVKGSIEYLESGRTCRINGIGINPAFVGTGTCDAITIASIGRGESSTGKFCCLIVVRDIHVSTAQKQAIVNAYIAGRYGL